MTSRTWWDLVDFSIFCFFLCVIINHLDSFSKTYVPTCRNTHAESSSVRQCYIWKVFLISGWNNNCETNSCQRIMNFYLTVTQTHILRTEMHTHTCTTFTHVKHELSSRTKSAWGYRILLFFSFFFSIVSFAALDTLNTAWSKKCWIMCWTTLSFIYSTHSPWCSHIKISETDQSSVHFENPAAAPQNPWFSVRLRHKLLWFICISISVVNMGWWEVHIFSFFFNLMMLLNVDTLWTVGATCDGCITSSAAPHTDHHSLWSETKLHLSIYLSPSYGTLTLHCTW